MQVHGEVAAGYEGVRDAFELAHRDEPGGSQLCVYRHGERIVDLWIGSDMATTRDETGDTLHVLMSATKGALALIVAMLVERGVLDVDAPVREYWPEFAVAGKEDSTTAHFLAHTAGLPTFRARPRIGAGDLSDWEKCTHALAEAEPFWRPGTAFTYHGFTYGFLVGEVIRRVTGVPAGRYFADNIAAPLGLDFWIGLPADRMPDVAFQAARTSEDYADVWSPDPFEQRTPELDEFLESWRNLGPRLLDGYLTTLEGRACELGAVNGVGSARSLAKMYAAALGEVDGVRLVSADALEFSLRSRNRGVPVWSPLAPTSAEAGDYGLGFTLTHPLGDRGRAATFGHPGAGGIQGFASVDLGVAVAYTSSAMHGRPTPDPRYGYLEALVDAGLA